MTIELAAFDMAGTTVQEGGAVYAALADAVAAATGEPVPDVALRWWMGADKREAVAGLLQGSADIEPVYADFRTRLAAAYAVRPPVALPGVAEAIATLRSGGTKVALTTGFSRDVADGILRELGWNVGETIDALVTVDDVAAGRPAPYMIYRAMEATGVHSVAAVLTAGDTVLDLRAGNNAGARYVLGVLTGAQDADALGKERHSHIVDSVADVPALLSTTG